MIILDTNVISELMRASPDPAVMEWVSQRDADDLYVSSISEAELWYGVELLPTGQRRDLLLREIEGMLKEDFAERILSFGGPAARAYAVIAASRRAAGRPISYPDCQIAAIAQAADASVATRNVRDFEGCGIDVVDPWQTVPR